ncbi:SpoIIE family protein phosphatase [uncultured Senegalimassilia sp.]|uniref:ATP-binding SpoIIE family protein phosphatase n=1 Tax=uncultured Senegalimassilia sp. TaxID=1714350 RepID=UPI002673AA83|nr:SpoIIE family protein phosphatase [uncultured Senegalimassilia sp.]
MDVFGEQMRGKAMGSVQPKDYATPGPASSDEAEGASPCAPENAPAAYARQTRKHSLGIGAACFIVYLVVLEAFLAVPQFNDIVQVRPASAFGPVLGLFFGLPGILGCAAANLVSDILHEGATPFMLAGYFVIQIMYNGLPRWVWYAVNRKSARPYPRFDSASKTALYMALALVDSACVNMAVYLFVGASPESGPAFAMRGLNNVWMLLYVGLPLLYVLERSPLTPTAPHWIHVPYRNTTEANLTQRFVITFVVASALLLLGISLAIIFFASGDEESFQTVVCTMYFEVALLTLPIFLPMFAFLHFLERRFTRPIEVLAHDQQTFIERMETDVEQGRRDTLIAVDERGTMPRYEIADLYRSTNKMRRDMVDFIERLYNVTAERQRTATELDVAKRIQMSAVPHDFDSFTERFALDIAGFMRPAREVGGDFYDVFEVGERGVAFVIGDVSGKGVPAALFMMRAQSLLRQYLLETEDLGTAFILANRQLCERNDAMLFVTAFACVVDTATGEVRFANAGHNPPVLKQNGKLSYLKCKPGLVLGAMDVVKYREGSFTCSPGDGLLLYTDGVSEAADEREQLYGEERLLQTLAALDAAAQTGAAASGGAPRGSSAQAAVDALAASVDAFAGNAPQADDITMLAFRWNLPIASLTLPAQDEQLDNLFAFLEPLCEGEGRTPKLLAQMMLVCEEIFVNICHYGFPDGQPRLPVDIEVAVDERAGCLHLVFSDQGIAYDPLSHDPKKVDPTDEQRKGGLGILLMRKYMDDLRYTRVDGRNILRMTKRFV